MRLTTVGCLVVALVAVCTAAQAGTIYVSTAGSDTNDGLRWPTAKKTVQAGLNAAAAGDQVWVAAGTYVERITLKAEVALYGGFAGGETDLTQRDWSANVTILYGNYSGNIVVGPVGATQATRIDGFTICNGGGTPLQEGGVYCYQSSPTIANNTICDNLAPGIYCRSASPAIINNTISGNAEGGVLCEHSSGTISENMISGNTGEGILCVFSSPTILENTISHNTGGGIFCLISSPTISSNMISGNNGIPGDRQWDDGGGIYCDDSSPTIANNMIMDNTGNGIFCLNSSPAIVSNTITTSTYAGIRWVDRDPLVIANCIVAFNSMGIVDAHYWGAGELPLRHNCVYGNPDGNYRGMTDPTGTNGNISADPKLADMPYDDGHIQPDSPCIDAGDDSVIQPDWMDQDGQTRIIGSHVDIGADESDGVVRALAPHEIIRVSPQGDDTNDGSSWALAKRTVQAAVDAIAVKRGEVWVAAGTYMGQITLRKHAHVYGGFAGTETERSARNVRSNVTILDGDEGGSVVTARDIPCQLGTVDGFTIRNGKAPYGGGVYCGYANPTISGNTIVSNNESAIYCSFSSPTIANNTITDNTAGCGGAVYLVTGFPMIIGNTISDNIGGRGIYGTDYYSGTGEGGHVTIADNTITGHSTSGPSGGIFLYSYRAVTITNNTISNNSAIGADVDGGGICCFARDSAVIAGNTITGNRASSAGGGIRCGAPVLTIAGNTIAGNTANTGGGMYCSGSNVTIAGNTIMNNRASNFGGGVYCGTYSTVTVTSNMIFANSADSGGGIYCPSASATIANSVLTSNIGRVNGGGIYCGEGSPKIASTIIAFNSSGIYKTGTGTPLLQYNCIFGNTAYNFSGLADPTGIDGNISVDPLLTRLPSSGVDGTWGTADDDYGDLHLLAGSPCINTGDPAYVPTAGESDFDGQPRVLYGRVDIGADEYRLAGDCDFDGFVNVGDLQVLVSSWGRSRASGGYSVGADLNGDGYVNVGDLQLLVAGWGKSLQ